MFSQTLKPKLKSSKKTKVNLKVELKEWTGLI